MEPDDEIVKEKKESSKNKKSKRTNKPMPRLNRGPIKAKKEYLENIKMTEGKQE